jgi:hypothetical protein
MNNEYIGQYAKKLFWCKTPGIIIDKRTGNEMNNIKSGMKPLFSGSVRQWYNTLGFAVLDAISETKTIDPANSKPVEIKAGIEALWILSHSDLYFAENDFSGKINGSRVTCDPALKDGIIVVGQDQNAILLTCFGMVYSEKEQYEGF